MLGKGLNFNFLYRSPGRLLQAIGRGVRLAVAYTGNPDHPVESYHNIISRDREVFSNFNPIDVRVGQPEGNDDLEPEQVIASSSSLSM
jgi:hypothetical protein